jgi:hypothetical protein
MIADKAGRSIRHQRSGVTGADRGSGVAHLDRVDRQAHRSGLGPAQRLGRFLVAADHVGGMEYLRRRAQVRMMVQSRLDPLFIADQQEFEAIVATPGERRAFDHHPHAFIAAHRIDGDTRQAHVRIIP